MFDLVVIFRFTAASRNLDAIRRLAPRAKVILNPVDLHFLREGREAELRGDAGMRQRAEKTRRAELDIISRVDCTVVHSTVEQELLAREKPDARVKVFTWALDAPGTHVPFGPRRDIAFIGGTSIRRTPTRRTISRPTSFPSCASTFPACDFKSSAAIPPGTAASCRATASTCWVCPRPLQTPRRPAPDGCAAAVRAESLGQHRRPA